MLSKNTCEGIHLIVKLPAVSLRTCKFTKNEPLHTHFSSLSGECTPWKSLVLMEEGGFEKNRRMGGACSPLWETLYCVGVFFAHGYTKLIFAVPTTHDQ